ncbi:MAG: helix-turn-helix transcriptional regulator [Pseudomonadota bacterium]
MTRKIRPKSSELLGAVGGPGERLREERERLGYSLSEFANKIGVHRNTQTNYELGKREFDQAYVEATKTLGVDVTYLLDAVRRDFLVRTETEQDLAAAVLEALGYSGEEKKKLDLAIDGLIALDESHSVTPEAISPERLRAVAKQIVHFSPAFTARPALENPLLRKKFIEPSGILSCRTDSDKGPICPVGSRIREERLYLGLTQEEFAKKLGVHRRSQGNYESDAREPDTAYLGAAFKAGVDVIYVLTGERTGYEHRTLVHMVDLMLDELELSHRNMEFMELQKQGYEAQLEIVRRGETKLADAADRAFLAFVRQSPRLIDLSALCSIIEQVDFVAETKGLQLTHEAKAKAITRLFAESKAHGRALSLTRVMEALES